MTTSAEPVAPATTSGTTGGGGSAQDRGRSLLRRWGPGTVELALLGALAYVPLLTVRPGVVTSDTKTYLYLDPGRFVRQVASMWDPTVALGTVTHEYIGYLLPMGPFYWFFSAVHVPIWVAQRLWLGTILFAAGTGILYACRVLGVARPGRTVGALAYMLSPYFLQYAGRISVILLPWAGLPWLLAFAALSLRRGGWRYPALFGLVVALVSGINATAILYAGIAPALWLVYATWANREATWGRAALTALRIGGLSILVSLWWIAGLRIEAAYGVNVLKYTETIPATSATSSAAEVVRGLGYWYFYGADRLGVWTEASVLYTQQVWLLALTYAVPTLSILAGVLVRWRHRAFFALLVLVGLVLSVGTFPYASPTPLGGLLKAFMSDTTAGLALRSTDRATPLLLLGLALLLAAGLSALSRRLPRTGAGTALVVGALVVANNPSLFNGQAEVASFFTQPAHLPAYQMAAISYLNRVNPGTRVLAIPGNDFASYRWGDTVDTPQPAFLTRPFAIHEQQVMGSMATADTLYAFDEPIQEGIEQWQSLAPMARLMSAGNILVEYDTRYEHYGIPQPQLMAQQLATTPSGLSDPHSFGAPVPNISTFSTLDEADLAAPANPPWPAPLVTYQVQGTRPITRAESNTGALVVAGDATGLENLASTGILDTTSAVYYAGTLDSHPSQLAQLLKGGATLVVTDTNRKQAFRWDTLTANTGYTETPSQHLAPSDPSDSPINLFPAAPLSAKTTASFVGAASVTASSYGNPVSYTPEDQPYAAVDGNLDTAWETGTFVPDPAGQWWQISYSHPVTTGKVTLVQPQNGDLARWITKVTLRFDGGAPVTATLGPSSRSPSGQVLTFPTRTFRTLRVTIDATSNDAAGPASSTAVGFAEVTVGGQHVVKVISMPQDLLSAAGTASQANPLVILMDRIRVSPFPTRSDPETTISRQFVLPTTRTFTLSGSASISALIPDDQIDRLVGRPGANGTGIVAYSRGRLPGDLRAGAAAALDGNTQTAWQPGFGAAAQKGSWLEYNLPKAITFDHLDLKIVADGRHSVPTSLEVATQNGTRKVTLPPIPDSRVPGATVAVPVRFPALTGNRIRITVTGVRLENTTNYYAAGPLAMPLGIAEVGIPGLTVPPVPAQLPGTCQSNLLSIDGHPVSIRIVGRSAQALSNGEMAIQPCGPDAKGITLGPGPHVVQTALGHTPTTGWNIDQLVLRSAAGGGPAAPAAPTTPSGAPNGAPGVAPVPGPAPALSVTSQGTTTQTLRIGGASSPFELVLGQSLNAGWQAVADPAPGAPPGTRPVDLGPPELVDGFANGWPVSAADLAALGALGAAGTGAFVVHLRWTPQAMVDAALVVSGATIAFCLLAGFLPPVVFWLRRRRRGSAPGSPDPPRRVARGLHRSRSVPPPSAPLTAGVPATLTAGPSATFEAGLPGPEGAAPVLEPPWRSAGRRPHPLVIGVAGILTGVATGAAVAPLVGVAVAVATMAALAIGPARLVTAATAVGLLAAGGALVTYSQHHAPVPPGADWPAAYTSAGVLVWMAVAFLAADGVVGAIRAAAGRRSRRHRRHRRHQAARET